MSGLLLGVDPGTASAKCVLARPEGEVVAALDAGNRELYDELYGVCRELYPATRGQMHRLADLQKGGESVVV